MSVTLVLGDDQPIILYGLEQLFAGEQDFRDAYRLIIFGLVKGRYTGARPLRSALQTTVTGGLAATAAFLIARAIT